MQQIKAPTNTRSRLQGDSERRSKSDRFGLGCSYSWGFKYRLAARASLCIRCSFIGTYLPSCVLGMSRYLLFLQICTNQYYYEFMYKRAFLGHWHFLLLRLRVVSRALRGTQAAPKNSTANACALVEFEVASNHGEAIRARGAIQFHTNRRTRYKLKNVRRLMMWYLGSEVVNVVRHYLVIERYFPDANLWDVPTHSVQ